MYVKTRNRNNREKHCEQLVSTNYFRLVTSAIKPNFQEAILFAFADKFEFGFLLTPQTNLRSASNPNAVKMFLP